MIITILCSTQIIWNGITYVSKIFMNLTTRKDISNILNKFNFRIKKNNTKTISYKLKIKYLLSKSVSILFLKEKYTSFRAFLGI